MVCISHGIRSSVPIFYHAFSDSCSVHQTLTVREIRLDFPCKNFRYSCTIWSAFNVLAHLIMSSTSFSSVWHRSVYFIFTVLNLYVHGSISRNVENNAAISSEDAQYSIPKNLNRWIFDDREQLLGRAENLTEHNDFAVITKFSKVRTTHIKYKRDGRYQNTLQSWTMKEINNLHVLQPSTIHQSVCKATTRSFINNEEWSTFWLL